MLRRHFAVVVPVILTASAATHASLIAGPPLAGIAISPTPIRSNTPAPMSKACPIGLIASTPGDLAWSFGVDLPATSPNGPRDNAVFGDRMTTSRIAGVLAPEAFRFRPLDRVSALLPAESTRPMAMSQAVLAGG
ncbi:MAG: hypothetical protein AB8G96_08390 [Phycisphaerales bacterium]